MSSLCGSLQEKRRAPREACPEGLVLTTLARSAALFSVKKASWLYWSKAVRLWITASLRSRRSAAYLRQVVHVNEDMFAFDKHRIDSIARTQLDCERVSGVVGNSRAPLMLDIIIVQVGAIGILHN